MDALITALRGLSSAEEIFQHFGVAFSQAALNVNRLHILRRFHQYLTQQSAPGDDSDAHARGAAMLRRAYDDFACSSAQQQKALNVRRRESTQRIDADTLRGSRPPRL